MSLISSGHIEAAWTDEVLFAGAWIIFHYFARDGGAGAAAAVGGCCGCCGGVGGCDCYGYYGLWLL